MQFCHWIGNLASDSTVTEFLHDAGFETQGVSTKAPSPHSFQWLPPETPTTRVGVVPSVQALASLPGGQQNCFKCSSPHKECSPSPQGSPDAALATATVVWTVAGLSKEGDDFVLMKSRGPLELTERRAWVPRDSAARLGKRATETKTRRRTAERCSRRHHPDTTGPRAGGLCGDRASSPAAPDSPLEAASASSRASHASALLPNDQATRPHLLPPG